MRVLGGLTVDASGAPLAPEIASPSVLKAADEFTDVYLSTHDYVVSTWHAKTESLIFSFLNSQLITKPAMRGMCWQASSLPSCQGWQSLAILLCEHLLLGQTLLFQSSVQSTFANTQVLGQLTAGTFESRQFLCQRAMAESS